VILLVSKYYSAMQKAFLLFIPLLIWGCEQDYDNVIDTSTENYQVSFIVGIKDTVDLKIPADSLLSLRLIFTPQSVVNKSFFSIIASDFTQLNASPIEMTEVSENVFENQFILTNENPNGMYTIKFSANGSDGINKQVAISNFYFNNGQDNVPPKISNLVCPDSIARGVSFVFSVTAVDSNGRTDILSTFFSLYRPDGTIVEESPGDIYFAMDDHGNLVVFGDTTANDGIYSFKNSFGSNSQTGNWKFVFQAIDWSDSLSNIIEHFLFVE
jgi:hypothetical protein